MMERVEKLVQSKTHYCPVVDTFTIKEHRPGSFSPRVDAIWFKKKKGIMVACYGDLWDYGDYTDETTLGEFLKLHTDGRYGGNPHARWDGTNMWMPSSTFEEMKKMKVRLETALNNYPELPKGCIGFYEFPKTKPDRKE